MYVVKSSQIEEVDWDLVEQCGGGGLYRAESLKAYKEVEVLTIFNQERPLAIWPIPIDWEKGKKIARRSIRLLPYHPPLLFKHHLLDKRVLTLTLIKAMQERYYAIDLPLAPDFHMLTPFSFLGVSVEWRNTYRFSLNHALSDHIHPKARNHIRSAEQKVKIHISKKGDEFNFTQGIKTADDKQRQARAALAIHLINRGEGVIFTTTQDGQEVGQALVVCDEHVGYLFHSWFHKKGVRGIPSLLIARAAEWVLKKRGLSYFDLEGSIIPSIDRFFASLGGVQTPYAYLHWCRDKSTMVSMIEDNVFMPIRLAMKDPAL